VISRQSELTRAKRIENDLAEKRNRVDAKTTAAAPVNGTPSPINGTRRKKGAIKNGHGDTAAKDPLKLTLECDMPNEQQSFARLAARMGSVEFDTTGALLSD